MNHYTVFELLWLFRIYKAYPKAKRIDLKEDADRTEEKAQVFAAGCGFIQMPSQWKLSSGEAAGISPDAEIRNSCMRMLLFAGYL